MTDTTTEAVERLAKDLVEHADGLRWADLDGRHYVVSQSDMEEAAASLRALLAERDALREALAWYGNAQDDRAKAEAKTFWLCDDKGGRLITLWMLGERARAALGGEHG